MDIQTLYASLEQHDSPREEILTLLHEMHKLGHTHLVNVVLSY